MNPVRLTASAQRATDRVTVRRACYAIAALLVVSGLVHLGVLLATHGSWYGPVSWRKPFTFGLSFGVTLATITWISSYVRIRDWLLWAFAAACVLEVALITVQAWRRTPSHFNLSTPLDGLVARTLAVGGAVLVGVVAVLTVSAFRRRPETAPSMRLAVRAGLVILDLAMLTGAAMIAIGMTRVLGGDQQDAYAAGARLKPVHGATMHAVLVLPALAFLLARADLSERRRVQVVWAAIGLYAIAAAAFSIIA
jgi:hypothetical protein